jgi:hypothetical protein
VEIVVFPPTAYERGVRLTGLIVRTGA